jgi:membrane protein implicated in regulation of membrane protease activity
MTWWIWMAVGLVLAAMEVVTPGGLVLVFFGAGAVVAGLLALTGLAPSLGLQLLVFAVISVVSLLLLRKPIQARLQPRARTQEVDALPGETARTEGPIAPGAYGRVELRGTTWTARNVGARPLVAGERCRVATVQGLELHVTSQEPS